MTDRPSCAIMGNLKKNVCGACLDILYTQSFVVQQTSKGERERYYSEAGKRVCHAKT